MFWGVLFWAAAGKQAGGQASKQASKQARKAHLFGEGPGLGSRDPWAQKDPRDPFCFDTMLV